MQYRLYNLILHLNAFLSENRYIWMLHTLYPTDVGREQYHEELKIVLTMFREKKATPRSNDTQEIWLNQHSTPREVQTWLEAKGFSEKYIRSISSQVNEPVAQYFYYIFTCRIRKQFENMDGIELFNLTRRQLEHYCGSSEGSRLNGQLTLARNESGVSLFVENVLYRLFYPLISVFSTKPRGRRNSSRS